MAQKEFEQGETVEWNTPQGKTRGTVRKKLTSDTQVGGQKITASEDDPRYLVESEKTSALFSAYLSRILWKANPLGIAPSGF